MRREHPHQLSIQISGEYISFYHRFTINKVLRYKEFPRSSESAIKDSLLAGNKKKNIVLLYPKLHFKQRHNPVSLVPLPIMALAAPLMSRGYNVEMVNGDLEPDWLEKVLRACREALLLGISSMSGPQIFYGLEAARAVREAGLKLPIIWGGYHPSILPEQTSENPYVDAVVRGQGELTLMEIADRISHGKDFADVAGVTITRDGETVSTEPRKMQDINSFPRLPYEKLAESEKYVNNMPSLGNRTVNYISSQGCPHRCQFCAEPLVYKRRWKALTPERVVSDLDFLQTFLGVNGVFYSDSNFFVNEGRANEIAAGMIRNGLKMNWSADARSSQLVKFSDETYATLKASGLNRIFVGVESGSNKTLAALQKDITVEETLEAVRTVTRQGISMTCFFMLGFPDESVSDMEETWKMVDQISSISGQHNSVMHFYAPTPGHALFERSCEMGFKRPASLEEWARFSTLDANAPWMSKKLINRMKQRNFYLTYNYPTEAIRRHAASSSAYRMYYSCAKKLSTLRCRKQFWGLPVDWWMLQGLRGETRS